MLTSPLRAAASHRFAAWLLIASPLAFVVAAAAVIGMDAGPIEDITPGVLARITGLWITFHLAYAVAVTLGAAGLLALGRHVRGPLSIVGSAFACVTVLVVLVFTALRLAMPGAGFVRLEDLAGFRLSLVLDLLGVWLAAATTVIAAVALRRAGVLRRTASLLAVLTALYLVADVVTGGGFPPFVVSLVWLVLGIALTRGQRVPSA